MNDSSRPSKKSVALLRVLVLVLIAVTVYGVQQLKNADTEYDQTDAIVASKPSIVKRVEIGSKTVAIPTYDLFEKGHVWALVSKAHPLKGEAGYTLIDIPVAHGDKSLPMKIAADISDELQQMVNAAEADGEPLMVSSAYRSLAEQQKTYDAFVAKNGKALASIYVSPVGASEHHTGLAVDLSSVSDQCSSDSNACSLSTSAAAWLAKNASRFGFIQRYPEGDQPITGVAFEPWHYRFVGIPLAQAIATSNLTYDEVVQQIAPGYAVDPH